MFLLKIIHKRKVCFYIFVDLFLVIVIVAQCRIYLP